MFQFVYKVCEIFTHRGSVDTVIVTATFKMCVLSLQEDIKYEVHNESRISQLELWRERVVNLPLVTHEKKTTFKDVFMDIMPAYHQ